MGKLILKGLVKLILGVILISFLLFLPVDSLNYTSGWLFIGVLIISMLIVGLFLIIKNPSLLEKRLNVKEKEKTQKIVIKLSGLMFILGFVLAGLSYRFKWIMLPLPVCFVASIFFLIFYGLYMQVMRENTFLSRTIEIQENQKGVDTGLYGIVRHPLYSVTVMMFIIIPFILGSVVSIPVFLVYPFIIANRIKNEEKVLEKGLEGYKEYKGKVKYRLMPYIW